MPTVPAPYPTRGETPWDITLKAYLDELSGGGTGTRKTVTVTTATLGVDADESLTVALGKGYRLLEVQSDRASRIRLYATPAQRTADVARDVGMDPTGDHGLMVEYVFTAAGTAVLSPVVDGFSAEDPPVAAIAYNITNTSASAASVTVTFTFVGTE